MFDLDISDMKLETTKFIEQINEFKTFKGKHFKNICDFSILSLFTDKIKYDINGNLTGTTQGESFVTSYNFSASNWK